MPAELLPASDNISGGFISMPYPHSPDGPWDLLQPYERSNIGASRLPVEFVRQQSIDADKAVEGKECPGGFRLR